MTHQKRKKLIHLEKKTIENMPLASFMRIANNKTIATKDSNAIEME